MLQAKLEGQERCLKTLAKSKVDIEVMVSNQANELARFQGAKTDER